MADEFARIARIARVLERVARDGAIETAIGDDAAVLRVDGELVWTIDAQVEGVHFRGDLLSDVDVGHRATVAAVSDVLAMGATPLAALVAWTIPDGFDEARIDAIAEGQRIASEALGCPVIGGNLARGPALSITTTAIGRVPAGRRAVGRSGARAGDVLVLAGEVGWAALGLRALLAGERSADVARFATAWRRPPVRTRESIVLGARAHAMIDVSDGLGQDVGHLAEASGVRAVLEEDRLLALVDAGFEAHARALGAAPLDLLLAGGEDYALVAAIAPADAASIPFARIGVLEAGAGVVVRGADGVFRAPPRGYRHST